MTAQETITLYADADRLARKLAARIESTWNITATEAVVLHLLSQGVTRPHELVDLLERPGPTVSHVITTLQASGLIDRVRHPEDGRGRTLHLTEEGERALKFVLDNLLAPAHRAFGAQLLAKTRNAADAA